MLQILCLPGYFTNKELMDFQLKNFKKYFGKMMNFTIIDPPNTFSDRQLIELDEGIKKFCIKTKTKPLNWWTYEDITEGPGKMEISFDKALQYLISCIQISNVKFDGIFGFSQGGALVDYMLYKAIDNSIIKSILPKFCIISSPNYVGYSGDFMNWKRVSIPIIFLIGEMDYFFLKGLFMSIIHNNALLITTKEGHKIPNLNDEQIKEISIFLKKLKGKTPKF